MEESLRRIEIQKCCQLMNDEKNNEYKNLKKTINGVYSPEALDMLSIIHRP